MPGRLAPVASPFDQGLSHFRDEYSHTTGLGIIPVAAAAEAVSAISSLFGGGGAEDKRRSDRVQYFLNAAMQGNVAAAQVILGGQHNTASHERPMWDKAAQVLQQSPNGASVYQSALQLGPYWSTSDSSTSYPQMQALVQSWAAQHATAGALASFGFPSGAANAVGSGLSTFVAPNPTTGAFSLSPWVLLAAGVAGVALLRSKKR